MKLICGRCDLSSKYETKNKHIKKLELIEDNKHSKIITQQQKI